jgi:hypothetical protein
MDKISQYRQQQTPKAELVPARKRREPKPKPGCIDPRSENYGRHKWDTWGSDPRYDICPRCKTSRIKPVKGLPRISERASTQRAKKTPKQLKAEIRAASIPLFPEEASQ